MAHGREGLPPGQSRRVAQAVLDVRHPPLAHPEFDVLRRMPAAAAVSGAELPRASEVSTRGVEAEIETAATEIAAWVTHNLFFNLNYNYFINFDFGIDNIFDKHYRTYSSGISAPGRNIRIGLNLKF